MSKELATQTTALDFTNQALIKTLKATVAQGLSDAEFALFAEHCKGTGLNPFKKEIWAIKAGGRLQLMTGLNGYMAIANSHPQFDGMEVEVDNDESPTKATCKVYRKDRKFPAVGVALMKEYRKDSPIWKQMPRVMLTKVAKSIAIREAFPQELNGTYTAEEMPADFSQPQEQKSAHPEVLPADRIQPKPKKAKPSKLEEGEFYYSTHTLEEDRLQDAITYLEKWGVERVAPHTFLSKVRIPKADELIIDKPDLSPNSAIDAVIGEDNVDFPNI